MTLELGAEALAIIEKVKKLLALANNNDNEHQAAAASAKAMELLAAYNLDMASVGTTSASGKREDSKLNGGLYGWQRDLWKAVAVLNFCLYECKKGNYKGSAYEHRLIGRKENVVGATVMAQYLQQTVDRLAKETANERGLNVFCREMIAYREGVASRLYERLNQLRRDKLAEDERKAREQSAASRHPASASTSNALTLVSVIQTEADLNQDYVYGYEPGYTAHYRAESLARRAAAEAAAEQALRQRDEDEDRNPELKAARLAREQKDAEEYEKWERAWRKRQERNERRRGGGYRYRANTPREQRASLREFGEGYERGDSIGLHQQLDENRKNRLK